MQPPREEGTGAVESPAGTFDPGPETGYLRRAPREGPLPVEEGARPFDPGPEIGFDGRRARRLRRRRERRDREREEAERRARAEAEEANERERERERAEAGQAERQEAEERARIEAEEAAELARSQAAERELEEAEAGAVAAAERARRETERQERAERAARAHAGAERAAKAKAKAARRAAAKAPAKPSPKARPRRRPARPTAPPPTASPKPKRAGRPEPAAPRARPGLVRPTAKLTAALAAAIAGAALLGSVLGLPTPFNGSNGTVGASLGPVPQLGVGTAAALYRGPFHPVRGDHDYGERGAEFGASRGGRKHEGQDIFSKSGTPLVAVRDGVVVDRAKESGAYSGGRGNYVAIYSPIENRSYVYLHLLKPALVDKGERVHAGQVIGLMGCTGSCYGTHLHFEVRIGRAGFAADTKATDPMDFLEELPQAPEDLGKP